MKMLWGSEVFFQWSCRKNDGEMVWFGVEAGGWVWKWVYVCVCVCVCLSKEKRKKMKERKERAGQKREERWVKMCGGEWG